MLEIFWIEFDVVADDVLQQSRHTHSILTDFASELVKHFSQLTADEYRLAVFNLVRAHKGLAVLIQWEFALFAAYSALDGWGWWLFLGNIGRWNFINILCNGRCCLLPFGLVLILMEEDVAWCFQLRNSPMRHQYFSFGSLLFASSARKNPSLSFFATRLYSKFLFYSFLKWFYKFNIWSLCTILTDYLLQRKCAYNSITTN